ncbi:unnamed protein product [Cunninghamella blakesleeana]
MVSPTFDLAQYPTIETIKLLASLLERMTSANDQLNKPSLLTRKASSGDMRRSTSASPIGNNNPLSSPIPTTTTNNTTNMTNTTTTTNPNYTLFHARSIPSIDIYSYLSRILKYCPCANECFLSLLVYFDRMSKHTLAKTGHPFTIDSFNIHRLIISGVMVSSKFFSDIFYTNTRYAKVGGLPVSELNRLELEFLQLNEFNISVSISELQKYGDQLLKLGMMEQQERRMMYDHPSSYTIRHGRSTSLGSTALIKTLDGLDMNSNKTRKSLDQPSIQQLTDTTSKLYLDDNSHVESSSIKQQRRSVNEMTNNKDMYTYATYTSPSSPLPIQANGLTASTSSTLSSSTSSSNVNSHLHLRRMGSMNNINSYQLQHSPISFISSDDPIIHNNNTNNNMITSLTASTSTSSSTSLMNTMTTPPLFIRQQSSSRYFDNNNNNNSGNGTSSNSNNNNRYHQRHSFIDWPTNNSPPKTRQRHESLGTNNKPISIDGSVGWRIPRQTRSSVNLYQQNLRWANNNNTGINHHHNNSTPLSSSLTSTSSSSSSIIDSSSTLQHHHQQHLYQLHQSSSHHQQQQRRLSLNSIHAPPFIPQRPSSGEYITCNNNSNGNGNGSSSYVFYPVTNYSQPPHHHHLGIPTPPPSSSPIHYKPENCHPYPSSSTQQLYL